MGAIVGVRGKATPAETMSRRYRRHATHRSGGKGQALLACRACKDSVTLTALEMQGQATDDLRGIPRPRVEREKIHVVEDDTISEEVLVNEIRMHTPCGRDYCPGRHYLAGSKLPARHPPPRPHPAPPWPPVSPRQMKAFTRNSLHSPESYGASKRQRQGIARRPSLYNPKMKGFYP